MKNNLLKTLFVSVLFLFVAKNLKAQEGCPLNFPYTQSFCFTNNSDYHDGGYFPAGACTYQICVKIKPKASCFPDCIYPSQDGYWSNYCVTIPVGSTECINIPSTNDPITDCWDVDITMKVVGNTITMVKNLETHFPSIGQEHMYHDHCLEEETWWSVLKLINGTGIYNFSIFTRGVL